MESRPLHGLQPECSSSPPKSVNPSSQIQLPSLARTGLLALPSRLRSECIERTRTRTFLPPGEELLIPPSRHPPPIQHYVYPTPYIHPNSIMWNPKMGVTTEDSGGYLDALVAASVVDKENSPMRHHCTFPGCGKSFPSRSRLQRHAVIHTGLKPFSCLYPSCSRTFSRRDNMLQHYRTHLVYVAPFNEDKQQQRTFVDSREDSTTAAVVALQSVIDD